MSTLLYIFIQGGLVYLKIAGYIAVAWWIVLIPTWFLAFFMTFGVIMAMLGLFAAGVAGISASRGARRRFR